MDSITASSNSGVSIPSYELVSAIILQALEHASSIEPTFSDEAGEYYAMAMASSSTAVDVQMNVDYFAVDRTAGGGNSGFYFSRCKQKHLHPASRQTAATYDLRRVPGILCRYA